MDRKFDGLSKANKSLSFEVEASECVKSRSSVADASRGQCEGESNPARCGSGHTPPPRPDNHNYNHNDMTVENKSPMKRKSTSEEENAISEVNELINKCLVGPEEKKNRFDTEELQMNVRITRSKANSCNNNKLVTQKPSSLKVETRKSARNVKKRTTDINIASEKESTFSFDFRQKRAERNNFSNKDLDNDMSNSKQKEKLSNEKTGITKLIDEQLSFMPDSQNTFCFSSSQARRRKLLSVDVLVPSQELIIPVTPDAREKMTRGPYAGLQIKGTRTQRAALRDQKDKSSSMPLPRNHKNSFYNRKKSVEFSSLIKGPKYEPTSEERDFVFVQSDNSSSQNLRKALRSEDEPFSSSGDESIFLGSKIRPLPQPRKSLDEFQLKNGLKTREKKGKSKSGKNPSICLTSVHSKEMSSLIPIIKKLGGYGITEHVNTSTTHVVCGATRRTMNLLFGVALGCWVVDVSWLYQSLEMETWAPEEPFEIFTFSPGAKICREQKQRQGALYNQTLFSGVGNIFVQEGCVPPSDQLRDLLQLCGAVVVSNVRSANLVIGKPTAVTETRGNFAQITHVSEKWVLDSIQYHKLQPFHLSPSQTTPS